MDQGIGPDASMQRVFALGTPPSILSGGPLMMYATSSATSPGAAERSTRKTGVPWVG
jgi:hypothetical protein